MKEKLNENPVHKDQVSLGQILESEKLKALADEVLDVARYRESQADDYQEVLVSVEPKHFLRAILGGVLFDEADRFRDNGFFISQAAVRHLEDCGIPVTRVQEEPLPRQPVPQEQTTWESETTQNGNPEDTYSGTKIIMQVKLGLNERKHKRLRNPVEIFA